MRKWKCSGLKIHNLYELTRCLEKFGGIWVEEYPAYARYESAGWVKSYQFNYIENQIKLGRFWWPLKVVAK